MLSFDVGALESRAVAVDGTLAPDDPVWQEGDPRPAEPIQVTGRLSPAGEGRFYFSGRIEGSVAGECRRCLADAGADVSDTAQFVFADVGNEEADDPDVFQLDPRAVTLDLRPAVREHWLLAAPAYLLCRDDCKGICLRCGATLNDHACECPPATDSRWDALRGVQGDRK